MSVWYVKTNDQMEEDKRHHYIVKICAEKGDHFYGGFRLMKGKCVYDNTHRMHFYAQRKQQ